MVEFFADLYRKQPLLTATAWIHVTLALVMLLGLAVDNRSILGLNPWIKPIKFAASIAVYLFTIALFISYLPQRHALLTWTAGVISATMLIEIALISMQALRGTTSHFNTTTPFDTVVFAAMGIAVAINTVAVLFVIWQYFEQPPALSPAFLWGIRLGLVVFVLGSIQGFLMASRMGHTVGAPDGGPGLPILNWSTRFGDLRVAHFIGLHGLQLIPLVGYLVAGSAAPEKNAPSSLLTVCAVAGISIGAMLWAHLQALAGRPLINGR
ncbi:hypothetical protein GF420_13435 [candidate division GN15 bacterium]|nr:hypothetical protein [candidate division GN15 bacterium]